MPGVGQRMSVTIPPGTATDRLLLAFRLAANTCEITLNTHP